MQRIGKRLISMVMAATLCVTMITPMGTGQVYATENISGQSEDGTTSGVSGEVQYKVVFQKTKEDNTKEDITSLSIKKGDPQVDLMQYMHVLKTEAETETEVENWKDGKITYTPNSDAVSVEDGKVSINENATAKEATVNVTWTSKTTPSVEAKGSIKINIEDSSSNISISIKKESKEIILNHTYNLSEDVKVEPDTAKENLVYSSDNIEVATVTEDGTVKAVGVGETKINVASKDQPEVKKSIEIKVMDAPASIKLNKTKHSMGFADTFQLEATVIWESEKKEKVDISKFRFESLNEKVATVDDKGLVKGVAQTTYPAMALIKISYSPDVEIDGEKMKDIDAQFQITITESPITGIAIDKSKMPTGNWKINDTYQLQLSLTPEGASSEDVEYKTSDKDIATVSKTGEIKATGIGKATITVYAKDNKNIKDTVEINVYQTVFNVAELGVNGADDKDDATDLNKILKYATLIDEMVTVIIPDGTYYLGSTLKVWTETNIQLSTNAVIKRMPSAEGKSMIVNRTSKNNGGYTAAHDIIISGGVWDGNTTGSDHSNLLYFGHAKNITIRNTTIRNDSGAHLIEFTGVQNAVVENVTLTGFVMSKNLSASQNAEKEAIQIDHCTGETNAPGMEPFDGTACDGITVRNCNISNYMAGIGTHTQGANASNNVLIENNVFNNITNACINLPNIQNVTIRNNTASNFTTFLYASGSQGLVENNKINNGTAFVPVTSSGLRAKNGITVSNGSNFVIRNNTIENAKSNGITVWNQSNAEITGNKIRKNQLYGVRTQGSTVTFKKNTLKKNVKGVYDTYKDATVTSSDDIRSYYVNIKKSYKYKGVAVKPKITIKGLKKKYYKVTYKNNKKPGTATVVIKGKKGVKQTLKIKFKIKKK